MPAFVSSLLLLPTPLVQRTSGRGPSVSPAMDLLHKHARIVPAPWRAPKRGRARLGAGRPGRIGLGARGALPRALAARLPGRLPRRPRRRGAEDIAQEAFLAAVRALDRFDRRRPFGPWLHRIVVNRAIDWSRARALRPRSSCRTSPRRQPPGGADDDRRGARRAAARAARRDRAPPLARVHAGRDRRPARAAARHRQLALRRGLDELR